MYVENVTVFFHLGVIVHIRFSLFSLAESLPHLK